MNPDPYSATVRSLFAAPVHAGNLDDATGLLLEKQGVRIELQASVDGTAIGQMRFRALGCPHLIAAAEYVCAHFEGRGIAALDEFDAGAVMQSLAVPVEKTGRILVLEDAVRALGAALRGASTSGSNQE